MPGRDGLNDGGSGSLSFVHLQKQFQSSVPFVSHSAFVSGGGGGPALWPRHIAMADKMRR